MSTFEDYVMKKYDVKNPKLIEALMGIEQFNPDKPKGLVYKVPVLSGKALYNEQIRLSNIAAQVTVTGGKTDFVPKYPDRKPGRQVDVRVVE